MDKNSNFVLIGFKRSGKTTLGRALAHHFDLQFIDTDSLIAPDCNQFYQQQGKEAFRQREEEVIRDLKGTKNALISIGAGAVLSPPSVHTLKKLGPLFYLYLDKDELKRRFQLPPVPAYFEGDFDAAFEKMYAERAPLYEQIADKVIFHEEELWQAIHSGVSFVSQPGENPTARPSAS
ncbi:MAG: hypothetical protein JSR58_03325 [Verrucomicrobia bacterium]|nr:hypothetical protein [Verrucomicrobiota bacterium]